MVRLKATSQRIDFTSNEISIPYGSIKSRLPFRGFYLGSPFQFLMVRLKVLTGIHFQRLTPISIPYGSIKRQQWFQQ